MPRNPSLARDAALRRLRRANRWLIAGAAAATGLFTEVAAQAFPGRTINRRDTASPVALAKQARSHHTRAHHHLRTDHGTHHALRPPSQAPRAHTHAQASPVASSTSPP